jgi:Cu/Ag efflux protein CusF
MNIKKGMVAGLGIASLLVALPAQAGSKASDTGSSGSKSSSSMGSDSSSTGSSGSMGAPGSTGSSSDTGATGSSAYPSAGGKNEITGKVEKFDRSSKQLTLALKVSDSTQVLKDGQQASLSDIKEGDQVRASFSGSGDTLQVSRIDIMSSGAKESPHGMGTGGSSTSPAPGSSSSPSAPSGSSPSGGSSGRGY